jgi:outer membrane lipoprotein-sorting protein
MRASLSGTTTRAILLMLVLPCFAYSQASEMVSADKFFAALSANYGTVKDYEAAVTITQGKSISRGRLSYKSPLYLRIDYDDPPKQVFCFDGEKLTFYSPVNDVVLEQKYKKKSNAQLEGLVSSQGLTLWQRNYSIGYLTGPTPVPLEEGSREMVTKLKLIAQGATGYKQMIVSVRDSLVRRIEGTLSSGDKVVMDFANVRLNQGLPDSRFAYDSPPDAYVIQDWLFDPQE